MNFIQVIVFIGAAMFMSGIGVAIVTRQSIDIRHYYLCLLLIFGGLFVMIGIPIISAIMRIFL